VAPSSQSPRDGQRPAASERARAAAVIREQRERHQHAQAELARRLTQQVDARVDELRTILQQGLSRQAALNFAALRAGPAVDLSHIRALPPAPEWGDYAPAAPHAFVRLFGGAARFDRREQEARRRFEQDLADHRRAGDERTRRIEEARTAHDRKLEPQRQRLAELHEAWLEQDKSAMEDYLQRALFDISLPAGFPREFDVAYDPRTSGALVKLQLPTRDVVPGERAYTYIKSRDELRSQPRPATEIASLYRTVVAQVALLSLRDMLVADSRLTGVAFNGHLRAVDPRTGNDVNPCLISVAVERDRFAELSLHRVSPDACLRHLNALVSPHPYDLEPITPLLDFDATKYLFTEALDIASGLDARPVLADLSPTEFEHLVRQLCEAMDMQSWTTRQSNDDGVDAVVFNPDPLVGGEAIVQAKRYRHVIGPQHVRELAGALEEKKASRGILITTSWFTTGAWDKARQHNRITLIDGPRLVHLLKDKLHKDVLTGVPVPPRYRSGGGSSAGRKSSK
jgi:restriction system protein